MNIPSVDDLRNFLQDYAVHPKRDSRRSLAALDGMPEKELREWTRFLVLTDPCANRLYDERFPV